MRPENACISNRHHSLFVSKRYGLNVPSKRGGNCTTTVQTTGANFGVNNSCAKFALSVVVPFYPVVRYCCNYKRGKTLAVLICIRKIALTRCKQLGVCVCAARPVRNYLAKAARDNGKKRALAVHYVSPLIHHFVKDGGVASVESSV